jgi:hypothetical protein
MYSAGQIHGHNDTYVYVCLYNNENRLKMVTVHFATASNRVKLLFYGDKILLAFRHNNSIYISPSI